MKRNTAFLIQKRDGRREWLRATKLARSIHAALTADNAILAGDPIGIAQSVLRDVLGRHARGSDLPRAVGVPALEPEALLTTAQLARAVERMLFASGHTRAAARYVGWARRKGPRSVGIAVGEPLRGVALASRRSTSDGPLPFFGPLGPSDRN